MVKALPSVGKATFSTVWVEPAVTPFWPTVKVAKVVVPEVTVITSPFWALAGIFTVTLVVVSLPFSANEITPLLSASLTITTSGADFGAVMARSITTACVASGPTWRWVSMMRATTLCEPIFKAVPVASSVQVVPFTVAFTKLWPPFKLTSTDSSASRALPKVPEITKVLSVVLKSPLVPVSSLMAVILMVLPTPAAKSITARSEPSLVPAALVMVALTCNVWPWAGRATLSTVWVEPAVTPFWPTVKVAKVVVPEVTVITSPSLASAGTFTVTLVVVSLPFSAAEI